MKDIRAGLKERLDFLTKERAAMRTRLSELESDEAAIRSLLKQEELRFGKLEPTLPFNGNGAAHGNSEATIKGRTPLSQMILGALLEASGRPLTLLEFKTKAKHQHFDFGQKAPGRVLHWALVGMEESRLIRKTEEGYTLAPMAPSVLNPAPPEVPY